eukprot:TRINITY_DN6040_c0_g1_i8.p1 TRINITY_DN6040_c0_g1~~TRINITY_DN6040_c0_g1_i8.p1  ORF type:complete len:405 (-),score=68.31 TRINITY_DN6040_c0_g1_i8:146-1360(-)
MCWSWLLSAFFTFSFCNEVGTVLKNGQTFDPFVIDGRISRSNDEIILSFIITQDCVTSLSLEMSDLANYSIMVSVSDATDTKGSFSKVGFYRTVGSGVFSTVYKPPVCAPTWKVIVSGGQPSYTIKDVYVSYESVATVKRTVTCAANSDCWALGVASANCQVNGTCQSCRSNDDCGMKDGGEIKHQPICNSTTGICGNCRSNDDCPKTAKNCGSDGTCYSCSYASGSLCGALDGPPGGPNNNQPNCDAMLGICVDGCTLDSHCAKNPEKPFCDVEKRTCVECLKNEDCPHPSWRESKRFHTTCSLSNNVCVKACMIDADCSPNTPACVVSLGICAECIFDGHCLNDPKRPYCHPTDLVCSDVDGWVDNSLSVGAKVGIVIGVVAGVLILIVVNVLISSAMLSAS